jgi:hypothetical protein
VQPDGHNGRRHQRADGHHGQCLDKHADCGQRRVDALAANHAGPEDYHHRLAGDVFSEVSDIIRPQRLPQAHRLPERPQRAVPEDAAEEHGQQIQSARGSQPADVKLPAMLAQLSPSIDDGAANVPYDEGHDQQFDRRDKPAPGAAGMIFVHERILSAAIVTGVGIVFK